MDYTQTIGNINELKCLIAIMQLGYECSIPYGNGAKYDFIADINGELLRFQCKSSSFVNDHGVIKEDAFSFHATCQTTNTKETIRHKYNSSQIDYFITSFLDKVYVVPVEECSTSKTLRFSPPNSECIQWNNAEDYLVEKYFSFGNHYLDSKEKYVNRNTTLVKSKQKNCYQNCGKEISYNAVYCQECSQVLSRKVDRPKRQELKELIRSKPFTQIGKIYGVTDNAIRKWCKQYDLPSKTGDIKKFTDIEWSNI